MTKKTKQFAKYLENIMGEDALEMLIGGSYNAIMDAAKGTDGFEIRSFKIVINDFFEYDMLKEAIVQERK